MFDFVCTWLGNYFGSPCDYSTDDLSIDEFMLTHCADWCDKHCGNVAAKHCWKRFFVELKMEGSK